MTKTLSKIITLTILLAFVFWQAASPVQAVKSDFSLRGDSNFNPNQLNAESRKWYDLVNKTIDRQKSGQDIYPDFTRGPREGELYSLGRTANDQIIAMLAVFRATGDYKMLDYVDSLMEIARGQLKDVWDPQCRQYPAGGRSNDYKCTYQKDGYLNFVYWAPVHREESRPGDSAIRAGYFGWDTHDMDESLTASLVAYYTYALRVNQDVKPQYKQHADFWQNWLVNHWEKKWLQRDGKYPVKNLTHVYVQFTRFHYYMYKLTGEKKYLDTANQRMENLRKLFTTVNTPNGQAYAWDHRVTTVENSPLGCQSSYYGGITLEGLTDLAFEGFGPFSSDEAMSKLSNTVTANIFKYGNTKIARYICGSGEDDLGRAAIYGMSAPIAFDKTGKAISQVENLFKAIDPSRTSSPRSLMLTSYLLAANVKKSGLQPYNGPQPSLTPTIAPSPSPSPTPTLRPSPSPSPSPVSSPSPTPTALPAGDISILPTDDAYVRSDYPNNNYGAGATMKINNQPQIINYFKFNLGVVNQTAYRVLFRVYMPTRSGTGGKITLRSVGSTAWSESAVNWGNKPTLGSQLAQVENAQTGQWLEYDVTSYVNANRGKAISLAIDTSDAGYGELNSKESAAKPELYVQFAPPTPSPSPQPVQTADGNDDGKVDGLDYVTFLMNFGRTNESRGAEKGDFNADGEINLSDLAMWLESQLFAN